MKIRALVLAVGILVFFLFISEPLVPVKSFHSGDSNRDLHVLQVTRGGQFPMVTVRTSLPEGASASATIHADQQSR